MCRYTHVESDKNGFSILRFSVFFQRFGPNKEYKNVKIIVIVESHGPKLLRGDLSGFGNGFFLGGGVVVGGSENRMESPNTRIKSKCTNVTKRGDTESPKACTRLKSCESLYTCSCAPFYRKTRGLLHSETTLESREYF
jgi:hypothetical protein